MKHYPIATLNNNRYRGPIETYKLNSFYQNVEYNINFLKDLFNLLEDRANEIDNNIRSRKYNNLGYNISNVLEFISMAVEDFEK